MNAQEFILPLVLQFVQCFTAPGFVHFQHFVLAHMALLGLPHCVTETLRLTQIHKILHWTTPYVFMQQSRRAGVAFFRTFALRKKSIWVIEPLAIVACVIAMLSRSCIDVLRSAMRRVLGLGAYGGAGIALSAPACHLAAN